MGVRTVFNILGPLSNPAEPPFHVIGAFNEATARLMAEALAGLPLQRAFVIHGACGWDEPSPLGLLPAAGCAQRHACEESRRTSRRLRHGRLQRRGSCSAADAAHNAAALTRVLRGEENGAHRDALLLSAALALEVTGRARWPACRPSQLAAAAIDDGRASALLAKLAAFSRSPQRAARHERRFPCRHGCQQPRARGRSPQAAQRRRNCGAGPRPRRSRRSWCCRPQGFDVIAEVKLRSPAVGC